MKGHLDNIGNHFVNNTAYIQQDNASNETCQLYIPISALAPKFGCLALVLVTNLALFIACVRERKKLQRQSSVYLCIATIFMMNVTLASLALLMDLHILSYPDEFPYTTGRYTTAKIVTLGFRAFIVSLQFSTSANVLATVFVLLDGGVFIGPRYNRINSKKELWYHKTKKKVSIIAVVLSCILPLLMTYLAAQFMSCIEDCYCEVMSVKGIACPPDPICSSIYPGLTLNFLRLNLSIWLIQFLSVTAFIIYAAFKYRKSLETAPTTDSTCSNTTLPSSKYRASIVSSTISSKNNNIGECTTDISSIGDVSVESSNPFGVITPSNIKKKKARLNKRFYFSILLLLLHCFAILPCATTGLEPFINLREARGPYIISIGVNHIVYLILSPLLILSYMPSVLSALQSLVRGIQRTIFPCFK